MKWFRPLIIVLIPLLHIAAFIALPLVGDFATWLFPDGKFAWGLFPNDQLVWWMFPVAFLMTDLLLFALTPPKSSWKVRMSTTLPPLLLIMSSLGLYMFLEDNALITRIALIAINALMQAIYLFNLYTYSYREHAHQERSLAHTSDYMNMITVFCSTSLLFAVVFFLDIPIAYLIPPFLLMIIGIVTQSLWINDIEIRAQRHLWVTIPLVMLELLYVLLWLPSLYYYYVEGMIVTVWYVCLIHLSVSAARKELEKREITTTIVITVVVLILLLTTAHWR